MALLGNDVAPLAVLKNWDLNTVGDTAVTIPNGGQRYYITDVIPTNASTSLGSSSATLGLYTAVSGGGTAIVTAATATGLTTSAKCRRSTVASSADTFTASTLYARIGVAHGSAATADLYIFGYYLSG